MSDRRSRLLAVLSVLAPLLFWSAVVLGALLRGPEYDHLTQAISELSVGENAPVMNAGFVAYGVVTIDFALGLRLGASAAIRVGFLLLALAGASTAALGLLWVAWAVANGAPVTAAPLDARGLTVDAWYDVIHNVLAGWAYALGAVGAISVGLGVRGGALRPAPAAYFVASGVAVIVLALYVEAARPVLDGLVQRVLVGLLQLWPAVYAIRSAAVARTAALASLARG